MAGAINMRTSVGFTVCNVTEMSIRRRTGNLAAGQHLILEYGDEPKGVTVHYIQVMRREEGDYQLEYREGSPGDHYQTFTASCDDVVAALLGWSKGESSWRDKFTWTCIGDMFTNPERSVPISE